MKLLDRLYEVDVLESRFVSMEQDIEALQSYVQYAREDIRDIVETTHMLRLLASWCLALLVVALLLAGVGLGIVLTA